MRISVTDIKVGCRSVLSVHRKDSAPRPRFSLTRGPRGKTPSGQEVNGERTTSEA